MFDETVVAPDGREGRQFGAYRILRRLGSGGMGQVYLAIHTHLGSHRALKFLSPELLLNQDMLHRLEQEARTASALNHPNILTIHEVGDFAGEHFIASEFVDGITLKHAIQRKIVDPEMAIRIATQVASALIAAHSAGVIHRDLKPANVMVRHDGYVKVIDFGLAKLTDESSVSRMHAGLSTPGFAVGTIDYMSPEQASGEEVDPRTDLWSLGVLLYEMLSSQRPFVGETYSQLMGAILTRSALPLPNLSALPPGVGRIVNRALMKDPAKRYQSAEEMFADLTALGTSSEGRRSTIKPGNLPGRHLRSVVYGIASVALMLVGGIWWWNLGGKGRFTEPDWFRVASVRQLTFNTRPLRCAISPDGKYLVFSVDNSGGMESLRIKRVSEPSDQSLVPSRHVNYLGLTFSRDSGSIYAVEKEERSNMGKLFTVPLIGDLPTRPIVEDIDGPVTFSPSGDHFAFVRWEQGSNASHARSVLDIAKADGSDIVPLVTSDDFRIFNQPSWTSAGKEIAAIIHDLSSPTGRLSVALFSRKGAQRRLPLPDWNSVGQIAWEQPTGLLLLSSASAIEASNRQQIREIDPDSGKTRDVTEDLSGYSTVSLTDDGQFIAAVRKDWQAGLWISNPKDLRNGQIQSSEAQEKGSLGWLDNDTLVVDSRRTGFSNLVSITALDRRESTLTNEPFMEQHAVVVGATKSVVFSSNRFGSFHIVRFDPPSNRYMQLSFGSSYDDMPSVSPDGRWVVYTSWTSGEPQLFKTLISGGTPVRVTEMSASDPQVSPDGKWIACQIRPKSRTIWSTAIVPFEGGGEMRILKSAQEPFRWSPSGTALTSSVTDPNGVSNLWQMPLDGSSPHQVTSFEDRVISSFAWSPSGKRLACIRQMPNSDVVLLKRDKR